MEPPVHQYEPFTTFTYAYFYYSVFLLLTCWLVAWRYLGEKRQQRRDEDSKHSPRETVGCGRVCTGSGMDYEFGHYVLPPDYADGAAYYNPTYADESDEDVDDDGDLLPLPEYTFLEPIPEETSDDLRSEESRSEASCGHWGWDGSSMDGASVIHVDVAAIAIDHPVKDDGKSLQCYNYLDDIKQTLPDSLCKDAELDKWLEDSIKELEGEDEGGMGCLESGLAGPAPTPVVVVAATDLDRRWSSSSSDRTFSCDLSGAELNTPATGAISVNDVDNQQCTRNQSSFSSNDVGQHCQKVGSTQNGSRISCSEGQHTAQKVRGNEKDSIGVERTPSQNAILGSKHLQKATVQRTLSTSRPLQLQNGKGDLYILFDRDKINSQNCNNAASSCHAHFADWDDALDLYLNSRSNAIGGALRRTASNEELISFANIDDDDDDDDDNNGATKNFEISTDKQSNWREAPAILFSRGDFGEKRTVRENRQQPNWLNRGGGEFPSNATGVPSLSSHNPPGYDQSVVSRDLCEEEDESGGSWESNSNSSSSSSDQELLGGKRKGSLHSRYVCQDLSQIAKFDEATDQLGDLTNSEPDSDDPGNYECFNGNVTYDASSLGQRSLSLGDLRTFSSSDVLHLVGVETGPEDRTCPNGGPTRPSNENLSEDSGYCDAAGKTDSNPLLDKAGSIDWDSTTTPTAQQYNLKSKSTDDAGESRKPFVIGVILEEEPEVPVTVSTSEFVKEDVVCAIVKPKNNLKMEEVLVSCIGNNKMMGNSEAGKLEDVTCAQNGIGSQPEIRDSGETGSNHEDPSIPEQKKEETSKIRPQQVLWTPNKSRNAYQPETGQFRKREVKVVTGSAVKNELPTAKKQQAKKSNWEDAIAALPTTTTTSNHQSWQEALLEREWERAMKSGRATTDDWLVLHQKNNQTDGRQLMDLKKIQWRSLPSLKENASEEEKEEDGDESPTPKLPGGSHQEPVSAPSSMLTDPNYFITDHSHPPKHKTTMVESCEGKTIMADSLAPSQMGVSQQISSDARRARENASGPQEGIKRHWHSKGEAETPNWEAGAERVVPLDLALLQLAEGQRRSQQLPTSPASTSKSSPDLQTEQTPSHHHQQLKLKHTDAGRKLSREFSKHRVHVPVATFWTASNDLTEPGTKQMSSNKRRPPPPPPPPSLRPTPGECPQRVTAPRDVIHVAGDASLPSNGEDDRHQTINKRGSEIDDSASLALQDSYIHLERAINYLQQDLRQQHGGSFYLHDPRLGDQVDKTSARKRLFSSLHDKTDPGSNLTLDTFSQRTQEGNKVIERDDETDRSSSLAATRASPPSAGSADATAASQHGTPALRSRSVGYIETNLDTLESKEIVCDNVGGRWIPHWNGTQHQQPKRSVVPHQPPHHPPSSSAAKKAFSMLSLRRPHDDQRDSDAGEDRARSMEFLLDAENKAAAEPPENQLMHVVSNNNNNDGRALSEHELRIRRSLQRLDVPEWFKNSPYSSSSCGSFILKKKTHEPQTQTQAHWTGLGSRTPSATSVSSSVAVTPSRPPSASSTSTRLPPPYCWRYPGRWSRESLPSPGSPSPSPLTEKGSIGTTTGQLHFSRWSSAASSTSPSPTGSLQRPATAGAMLSVPGGSGPPLLTRQPYLGWRSSERLSREVSSTNSTPTHNPAASGFYRSAAERLSAGPGYYALRYGNYPFKQPSSEGNLLSARKAISADPSPTDPTLASSIGKERSMVTSPSTASSKPPIPPKPALSPTSGVYRSAATVIIHQQPVNGKIGGDEDERHHLYHHHGNHVEDEDGGSPKSPRQRVIWMESSFVGVKPTGASGQEKMTEEVVTSESAMESTTPAETSTVGEELVRSRQNSDDEARLAKAKRSFGQIHYDEENQSRDSGSSVAGLEEVLDSLLAIPSSSRSVSPASRSRFYCGGDDSDSDARGTSTTPSRSPSRRASGHINTTDVLMYEDPTGRRPDIHGLISDHLLAPCTALPSLDLRDLSQPEETTSDDDEIGEGRVLKDRSPRPPTPPPRRTSTPLQSDGEPQLHHVHWGNLPDGGNLLDKEIFPDGGNYGTSADGATATNTKTMPVLADRAMATEAVIITTAASAVTDSVPTDPVFARRGSEHLRNLLPDNLLVRCSYVACSKTVEWVEARRSFKTCHNCYTYYCSRECRRLHWDKHRRTCMYSRIRSLCKHVILRSRDDQAVQAHLTKLARTGTLTQGRGFVKLGFRNPELVARFLKQGWSALEDNPIYVAWRDLMPQELGDEIFHELTEMCKQYDPETKFVLLAAVYVTREIPDQPVPRWEREVIAKCAKVPLRKPGSGGSAGKLPTATEEYGDPELEPDTLILTAVPQQSDMSPKRARELCFQNIRRILRQRGVSLHHQFPEVFEKLAAYVEQSETFLPITIYPKDGRTGKTFMCLIMPNTEPEVATMVSDFSRK